MSLAAQSLMMNILLLKNADEMKFDRSLRGGIPSHNKVRGRTRVRDPRRSETLRHASSDVPFCEGFFCDYKHADQRNKIPLENQGIPAFPYAP